MEDYKYIEINNYDNGYIAELNCYKSVVDYSEYFDNIPEEVKLDLDEETKKYYEVFSKLGVGTTYSLFLDIVRPVAEFDIDIEITMRNYTNLSKLGFTVFLKNSVYPVNLQSFYYLNIDFSKLHNYIYNILFHIYIFIRHFKYSPLFNYLHNEKDIQNMIDIRMRGLRLFGNLENIDCIVCMEKTINMTVCKHTLCQKCFSKISPKVCPMCRHDLEYVEDDDINIILT